jgi:RNA polymerase sigma-70 factor (ECF subfamily)
MTLVLTARAACSFEAADSKAAEDAALVRAMAQAQPRLARLVQRLLGWPDQGWVEDVVQDTFVAAWQRRGSFRGDSGIETWLVAIAVRKARNRSRWLRLRRALSLASEPVANPGAETRDEDALLRAHVAALPGRDREAIVLRYFEEQDIAAMAAVLGIDRAAVDARLSRARKRLRRSLEAAGHAEVLRG